MSSEPKKVDQAGSDAYSLALRGFIDAYSSVENLALTLFVTAKNVDFDVAKRVFSKGSISELLNELRKAIQDSGQEVSATLSRAFDQLAAIGFARSQIDRGNLASAKMGAAFLSPSEDSDAGGAQPHKAIDVTTLDAMRADLGTIQASFSMETLRQAGVVPAVEEAWSEAAERAWLYNRS